jgi:SAM-dependent methyltransferase
MQTTETSHKQCLDMDAWFAETSQALVTHAGRGKKKMSVKDAQREKKEAAQRSKALSTSADTRGVKFSGAEFQAMYFASKFKRRGALLYKLLVDLKCDFGAEKEEKESTKSKNKTQLQGRRRLRVASFGGGPGCDASGLVWLQKYVCPNLDFHCTLYDFERTWKRYLGTLQASVAAVVGDSVTLDFQPCDVTRSLLHEGNRKVVDVEELDLILFFYVCHETSTAANAQQLVFYKDLAKRCKPGCIVVCTDVTHHSRQDLELVKQALGTNRTLQALTPSKAHNAEVLAFQYLEGDQGGGGEGVEFANSTSEWGDRAEWGEI